jgi:pilus assembly protein CpaC
VTESLSKIPGLAHLPILGALFRSRSENRTKTELVVMVTPEIAVPVNTGELRPLTLPKQVLPPQLNAPPGAAPERKKRKEKE